MCSLGRNVSPLVHWMITGPQWKKVPGFIQTFATVREAGNWTAVFNKPWRTYFLDHTATIWTIQRQGDGLEVLCRNLDLNWLVLTSGKLVKLFFLSSLTRDLLWHHPPADHKDLFQASFFQASFPKLILIIQLPIPAGILCEHSSSAGNTQPSHSEKSQRGKETKEQNTHLAKTKPEMSTQILSIPNPDAKAPA